MILLEKTSVHGFEEAIRGMRNPMNSWSKSDSVRCTKKHPDEVCSICEDRHTGRCNDGFVLGNDDLKLMIKLAQGGPVHAKYRRMITVSVDITAPLYWWKEFDTYKVGTVANSCSTMHKIHAKDFELDDFSHEHLGEDLEGDLNISMACLKQTIRVLNTARSWYISNGNKDLWWQMIQLLPSSYNQKRTVMMNYEVLRGIYPMRKDHKLDEWHVFCDWIKELPYSEVITAGIEVPKQETFITEYDRLVISAYTGYMLCDFDQLHVFIARMLGRTVFTHELANEALTRELQSKLEPEWQRICSAARETK